MRNKKSLHTNVKIDNKTYRMFKVTSNQITDIKQAMRWVRRNSISDFCIAEHTRPFDDVENKMDAMRMLFSDNENVKYRVIVGFSDDSDSMALKLTFGGVEEIKMYPENLRFSVYTVIKD